MPIHSSNIITINSTRDRRLSLPNITIFEAVLGLEQGSISRDASAIYRSFLVKGKVVPEGYTGSLRDYAHLRAAKSVVEDRICGPTWSDIFEICLWIEANC